MNENQEYAKFWLSVKNKCDEIQKEYDKLTKANKKQVDCLLDTISNAHSISEAIKLINRQIDKG